MKQFLKYVLATIVGIIIINVIVVLFFLGAIGAAIKSSTHKQTVKVHNNTILLLKLNAKIVDRAEDNPLNNLHIGGFNTANIMGLNHILKDIDQAEKDKHIKGILLDVGGLQAGFATIENIRQKLLEFKKTGKFIISYAEVYTQRNYYLASVANKVYLNPAGLMEIKGLAVKEMFFKKAMDKLGVQAQIIRHGKFKSAVEPFMLDSMSKANRLQVHVFLDAIWHQWVIDVAASRHIAADEINKVADSLLVNEASDAVKYGFVDSTIYRDQLMNILQKKMSVTSTDDLHFMTLAKYDNTFENNTLEQYVSKNKIAVIYASGDIIDGKSTDDKMGSITICKALKKARTNPKVKAIVLRINSPGGSAMASDVIWREVSLAKKTKPVIVSMGDVAASGGYYIACDATKIVAEPTTITGSIGVFGIIPNAKGFFNKFLGINIDTVKTNKHSDLFTLYRPLTPYETSVIKDNIEHTYHTFVTRVSNGRKKSYNYIDSIAQGRVWCGTNAKANGLVDEFGGLEKAISIAAKTANISKYGIINLPEQKSALDQIINAFGGKVETHILKSQLGDKVSAYKHLLEVKNYHGIMARLPMEFEIH